jgi:TRAP-type transport system small permease protein
MSKFLNGYCRLLGIIIATMLAIMVVLVFGNVVMRYGFNSGITLSEELSRWLFVWLTFLGAVIALNERGHLGTDTLVARLPVRGKKICLGLSYLLMLYMCWLIFWGTWEQTKINLETTSAVMETSMAIFYACGLVFAVSAALILLNNFWRLLSGQMSESELVGVTESEDVGHEKPADISSNK